MTNISNPTRSTGQVQTTVAILTRARHGDRKTTQAIVQTPLLKRTLGPKDGKTANPKAIPHGTMPPRVAGMIHQLQAIPQVTLLMTGMDGWTQTLPMETKASTARAHPKAAIGVVEEEGREPMMGSM